MVCVISKVWFPQKGPILEIIWQEIAFSMEPTSVYFAGSKFYINIRRLLVFKYKPSFYLPHSCTIRMRLVGKTVWQLSRVKRE